MTDKWDLMKCLTLLEDIRLRLATLIHHAPDGNEKFFLETARDVLGKVADQWMVKSMLGLTGGDEGEAS